jgi:integrase
MLNRWLADCDIRDEHDQPARPTPHQWRHTFASRLKVRGVESNASFSIRAKRGGLSS